MNQRLKTLYIDKVREELQEQFQYKNLHEIPQLQKIVLNRGLSALAAPVSSGKSNDGGLQASLDELKLLTGQKAVVTLAKTSVAGFKIREGMPVGFTVTLRNQKMYAFLDRLINLALPRQRDFQGLNPESFDGHGNYTLGLTEQLLFPEINYEKIDRLRGMDITIVTTAQTDQEGLSLLQCLGMPFALPADDE